MNTFSSRKIIALVLFLKIALAFFFIFLQEKTPSLSFLSDIDTSEYIAPMDNYVDYGNYALTPTSEPYAGRLPGFVFPYLLFRLLFSKTVSSLLLGFFILGISVVSSYCLIKIIKTYTHYLLPMLLALLALEIIPYYWRFNWTLHPNYLAASLLIILIFFIQRNLQTPIKRELFLIGFLLIWIMLLRGFTILFIPITLFIFFIALKQKQFSLKRIVIHLLIIIIPIFFIESVWIARNLIALKQFVPLQTSFVPGSNNKSSEYTYESRTKYSIFKLRELIACWGGDNFWYFKNADMKWFTEADDSLPANRMFSENIFGGSFTPQLLDSLKNDVSFSYSVGLTKSQHDSIEEHIVNFSEQLKTEFKKNKPFYFYFVAPIKRCGNLVIANTVQDWIGVSFKKSSLAFKTLKLLSLAVYYLMLIIGIYTVFFNLKFIVRDTFLLLLTLFAGSILFTFMFIVNAAHYSYFIYGYIPLCILNFIFFTIIRVGRVPAQL